MSITRIQSEKEEIDMYADFMYISYYIYAFAGIILFSNNLELTKIYSDKRAVRDDPSGTSSRACNSK